MKKKSRIIILLILSFLTVFILLGVIIFIRSREPKITVGRREAQELRPIMADKVSLYMEPGETVFYGGTTSSNNMGSYRFSDFENETSLRFWIEKEEGECDIPKIYRKTDSEYVDMNPSDSKAEIIMGDSMLLFDFTFYSIGELKEGNYYRIEYGPYTVDFFMAMNKYDMYF